MKKNLLVVLSPFAVIGIGSLVIRLAAVYLGVWAWVPWILVYWGMIGLLVFWIGGKASIKKWWAKPTGNWFWSALAVLIGLSSLYIFASSWRVLLPLQVFIPWLIVGLLNPFLEEWYWRGLLLDYTKEWKSWVSILLFSVLFSLNHLLGIGVTSIGCRHPVLIMNALVVGILYSWVYKKTKSLRWAIVGHALADLLGLSVAVFLNLWVPPG